MSFPNFLDLRFLPVKDAEAVIVPIPYEATTTYGSGTREAPEAILGRVPAGGAVDEEDGWDPSAALRLATAAPLTAEVSGPQAMLDKIRKNVQAWVAQGKVVLALGGEHTITLPLVQSVQTKIPGPPDRGPGRPRRHAGQLRGQQALPRLRLKKGV